MCQCYLLLHCCYLDLFAIVNNTTISCIDKSYRYLQAIFSRHKCWKTIFIYYSINWIYAILVYKYSFCQKNIYINHVFLHFFVLFLLYVVCIPRVVNAKPSSIVFLVTKMHRLSCSIKHTSHFPCRVHCTASHWTFSFYSFFNKNICTCHRLSRRRRLLLLLL